MRLESICITLSISASLPTIGSNLPSFAICVKSVPKPSNSFNDTFALFTCAEPSDNGLLVLKICSIISLKLSIPIWASKFFASHLRVARSETHKSSALISGDCLFRAKAAAPSIISLQFIVNGTPSGICAPCTFCDACAKTSYTFSKFIPILLNKS